MTTLFKFFNVSNSGVKITMVSKILGMKNALPLSFTLPYDPNQELLDSLNDLGSFVQKQLSVEVPFAQITGYRISPCGSTDLITIYYNQKEGCNVAQFGEMFCRCKKLEQEVIDEMDDKLTHLGEMISSYIKGRRDNRTVRQKISSKINTIINKNSTKRS